MEQKIIDAGFKFYADCSCGGIYTKKYRNQTMVIKYRPSKKTFALFSRNGNIRKTAWLNESTNNLEDAIQKNA